MTDSEYKTLSEYRESLFRLFGSINSKITDEKIEHFPNETVDLINRFRAVLSELRKIVDSLVFNFSDSDFFLSWFSQVESYLKGISKNLDSRIDPQISKIHMNFLEVSIRDLSKISTDGAYLRRLNIDNEFTEEKTVNENQKFVEKLAGFENEYRNKLDEITKIQLNLQSESHSVIDRFEKKTQESLQNFESNFKNLTKPLVDMLDETHASTTLSLEKIRELQKELSGRTLSDFFARRANFEAEKASLWTKATWFFAIAALLVLGIILYSQIYNGTQNKDIDLQFLGTKVLITATLGFIAKWTSKRANRHLYDESKYHRLAINILTVESFTSNLGLEYRSEILKAVALKVFTETGGNDSPTDYESTTNILDGLKDLLPKGK